VVEYSGILIDGPIAGIHVRSSVARIPVKDTIEMWLDGPSDDKTVDVTIKKGNYIWQPDDEVFKWELEGTGYFTQKEIELV
jgi:hypothetical protein